MDISTFLNDNGQCIRVYIARVITKDPYDSAEIEKELYPVSIKAIVTDYTSAQAMWKVVGIKTNMVKEIVTGKENRTLIEKSDKIQIKVNNKWVDFFGWKTPSQMQIREEGDSIRLYVYN